MFVESLYFDLRSAVRNAIRRPAFTALIALTLALGLGVNGAVFALVDAVLVRPLPYTDPSRLVFVWQTLPKHNVMEVEATPFDYQAWHSVESFSELAMIAYGSFSVGDQAADPERVRGARVTASLMPMLGLAPARGRGFAPAEDLDDATPVAILSDGLWRRRYGGDPSVVGRTIDVDGTPRVVVGVMMRHALLPGAVGGDSDLWLPMRLTPAERVNETSHNYTIVGRLAAGVPLTRAAVELDAFAARMAAERRSHADIGARLVPVAERTVREIRPALLVGATSVALLLLVATANASTLLIARATSRRAELAVRAALGATRGRLLLLAAIEGLLLAIVGGGVGLMFGSWALGALRPLFADSLPAVLRVAIDLRTVIFLGALTLIIGLIFGVVVAYRPGTRLADALGGGTRSTAGAATGRARSGLVVAQVALAVVLLSTAGLLLNSVVRLARVNPGFAADHLLTFKITLTGSRYEGASARLGAATTVLERMAALPGVESVGLASVVPFGGQRNGDVILIEGRTPAPGEPVMIIDQRHVSSSYFHTMGIPLVSGRLLTDDDTSRSERVVVINRTMARRRFPNESPLNQRVRFSGHADGAVWFRIVGVVGDVRHVSLSRDPVEEMYHPIAQTAVPTFTIVARTIGDPAAMAPSARAAVRAVDSGLPLYELRTMDDRIAGSFAQTRATMLLLIAAAGLAAALAAVAIYGSIWYSVSQRIPEIGVRLALGATRASVGRSVIGRALVLALVGSALGCAAAIAAGPLVRAMLFETTTVDPRTYAIVVGVLLVLTVVASAVPARRAMSVDPMAALRSQ
jgi:putative ABC transport system permease protein